MSICLIFVSNPRVEGERIYTHADALDFLRQKNKVQEESFNLSYHLGAQRAEWAKERQQYQATINGKLSDFRRYLLQFSQISFLQA